MKHKIIVPIGVLVLCVSMLFPSVVAAADTDNQNWMEQVSGSDPNFGDRGLNQIILPGTHDSGTATFDDPNDPKDPGPDFWNLANPLISASAQAAKGITIKWSQTQQSAVKDQLHKGVRYFDLRVAPNVWNKGWNEVNVQETNLRTLHGLYGEPVENILYDTKRFLDTHPKEVVILDFQHFHEMTENGYLHLNRRIQDIFGSMLIPPSYGANVPLHRLWKENKRVIVLYGTDNQRYKSPIDIRERYANDFQKWIWDRHALLRSKWPNTMDTQVLKQVLDEEVRLNQTNDDHFCVLQGVLTPQTESIIKGTINISESSLREVAGKANRVVLNGLQNDWKNQKLNVIEVDFFDDTDLVDVMIQMNKNRP
ncbi:phosphatidylinositol-specific phospholipase C domain-containing protein [Laceyella putida]|uniref:1-phosphatidylinositol phosphodiesterase n=1 Tax=Laceyella putida TaxID=110101 RepID=A0ABW2RF71_9BACL